jgi:hypothetical protein
MVYANVSTPVFHVKRLRLWLPLLLAAGACESPSDVLPGPGDWVPAASGFGVRLTAAPGPDVVRSILPDGRILFRARDLPPFGAGWVLASIRLDSGPAREEAALYRRAFLADMGSLTAADGRRVLALWTASVPGIDACPTPAPAAPGVVWVELVELGLTDGTPIAALPTRAVRTGAVTGAGTGNLRVRVSPALREADATGGNPFGPALAQGGSIVYSDGDSLWLARIDGSDDPLFLGIGAYPATSPDRRLVAFARPVGLDSTIANYVVPVGIGVCLQEHVEVTNTGWQVVVLDLDSRTETVLGAGLEPVHDPLAARVLARDGGLVWYDLSGAARSDLAGSAGSFAPAISPDGSILAFSRSDNGNTDVFAIRISR